MIALVGKTQDGSSGQVTCETNGIGIGGGSPAPGQIVHYARAMTETGNAPLAPKPAD